VFWSILHRTILWELTRIFLMSLIGITGMLMMAGIVAEASQRGLSATQILAVIPMLIPNTLPYTIPATTLFATCVVYGRLAADNEILAIKAAGINILSVISPALFLGLAMTALTVYFYYDLIPNTHWMMRSMVMDDVEEFLYGVLRREHSINHPKLNYTMHVRRVEGKVLIDPVFVRKDPKTKLVDVTARAQEAVMRVDMAHKQILFQMKHCYVTPMNGDSGVIDYQVYPVDLPPEFSEMTKKTRPTDMKWDEMVRFRDELSEQKEQLEAELALVIDLNEKGKQGLADHLVQLRYACRQKATEIRSVDAEMLMRPALAAGCFCFVVIGCPIGIWFSKSDYLSAFITCFLPIVFIYYPLLLCGANLAKTGKLNAFLAIWLADGLMALAALPLYRKLLQH
jgi:lipopolysaccharide export system permease protein